MSHQATHTLNGKASFADRFTVEAMGGNWSQRGSSITLPVLGYNKPEDTTGVEFGDGGTQI
jgi:hypothetical protein